MLISESVLRELYPRDLGLESPNPANHYQLSRHNLGPFSSLGLGIPYKWAQRMAGLHFASTNVCEQKVNEDCWIFFFPPPKKSIIHANM